jgi:DNA-binding NtrC family response regulator
LQNIGKKYKLLIVDDDEDILFAFKKSLELNDFVVDAYTNPIDALSKFKINTYDFALLDVVMPEMDGFELYDKLKKIDSNLKICFVTAYGVNYKSLLNIFDKPDIDGAYFKKPIEIEKLVKYINKELNNISNKKK